MITRRTFLGAAGLLAAAEPRPKITGIPLIALNSKDLEASRQYYRDFLGFQPAYTLDAGAVLFKINDRQFVELRPEREPGSDRLHQISLQTDDAERMRKYLSAQAVRVPDRVPTDALGRKAFSFTDPEGNSVRVVQYLPDSRIRRNRGKFLGTSRIAERMMHVGIIITRLDPALRFYRDVLGFQEFWRGSSNGTQLSWINLKVPDGEDYIELMLYKDAPPTTNRGSAHHLCLEVPSVPDAATRLERTAYRTRYTRKLEVRVGRNRRRQLNLFDPDGTRAELMESATVDGVPAESSTAPPPA